MPEEKSLANPSQEKPVAPRLEILQYILDLHMRLHEITYTNAYLFISATGVILTIIIALVLPNIKDFSNLAKAGITVIAIASFAALLLNIDIINPKIGKKIERKNLFYYSSFLDHCSKDEYANELSKLIKNEEHIIEQYAKEIYDLSQHVLAPKFKHLNHTANILLVGIVVGMGLILASVIF